MYAVHDVHEAVHVGDGARPARWVDTFTLDGSPGIFPSPIHYEDHAFADLSSAAADTLGHSTISSFAASESICQLLIPLTNFPWVRWRRADV